MHEIRNAKLMSHRWNTDQTPITIRVGSVLLSFSFFACRAKSCPSQEEHESTKHERPKQISAILFIRVFAFRVFVFLLIHHCRACGCGSVALGCPWLFIFPDFALNCPIRPHFSRGFPNANAFPSVQKVVMCACVCVQNLQAQCNPSARRP